MAYETKVILILIAKYIKSKRRNATAEQLEILLDIYDYLADTANAEGIVLKPFEEEK